MQTRGTIVFSKHKNKLDSLLSRKKILLETRAVFPFQLKPDQLIIDTFKVTIIYNQFFGSVITETILIGSIGDVDISVSFFFGALKILSLDHNRQWIEIKGLSKKNAFKAKRIIEGLLIANKEGITFEGNEEIDLANKLEKLGSPD